jgi:hypothetical protein
MESRVTSPLSDYRGNNSDNDDLVSNYSTVIRNSQLTIKNRQSMESTSSLMRKDSQSSTHSFLSQPAPLPVVKSRSNQFRPERRHTLSSNTVQEVIHIINTYTVSIYIFIYKKKNRITIIINITIHDLHLITLTMPNYNPFCLLQPW